MTKCKYSELPNAELDRLVAERVMGWKYSPFTYKHDCKKELYDAWILPDKEIAEVLPYFTTSMDACLSYVVPAMRKREFHFNVCTCEMCKVHQPVAFTACFYLDAENVKDDCQGDGYNDSLPRATCIAALLALDAMNKAEDPFD